MSTERELLADTAQRLFRDALDAASPEVHADAQLDARLWAQVEALGLPALLVPESSGGAGGCWQDAAVVVRAMGGYATALPLAESMLAANLLATAGLPVPAGPLSLATRCTGVLTRTAQGEARFRGELHGVPWGAQVEAVVARVGDEADGQLVLLRPAQACELRRGLNPAGEPRDRLCFDQVPVEWQAEAHGLGPRQLLEDSVLLRLGQIAGALGAALTCSVEYARSRRQFGRPIGQFQSVQQALAAMAGEVAAVDCAVAAAFRAADSLGEIGDAGFEIACAKLRANQAIDLGVATAHQVHGAIGFTHEYRLRRYTQRLIGWRSEFGSDREWAARLGESVAAHGADAFWSRLTARDDAIGVEPSGLD